MPLRVRDVEKIIEEFAPEKLKESYDNVGLMVGERNSEVTSILIALDCTLNVIQEAADKNCNMIITHHPLLFRKPSSITTDSLQGKKIIQLIRQGINLYSAHTNLDSVQGGLNDLLCHILKLQVTEVISPLEKDTVTSGGIGRISNLKESVKLDELCCRIKNALGLERVRYSGEDNKIIERLAIINGSGEDYIKFAEAMGADCIITGDTTYHYVSDYSEQGIAVIDAGHFATEWPAFKLFAAILKDKFAQAGYENSVIISEKTEDPYKYK